MSNMPRVRAAYRAFRDGFVKGHPPLWEDLSDWMRDAMLVAYLQGKLDK